MKKELTLQEINKQSAVIQTGEGMINFLEDVLGRNLVPGKAAQQSLYKKLGELCEERGWIDGAVTAYKKAGLDLLPIWKRIGERLQQEGLYDEAADAFIHSGMSKSLAWKHAALQYEQQGFYAEAAECYTKAGLQKKAAVLLHVQKKK